MLKQVLTVVLVLFATTLFAQDTTKTVKPKQEVVKKDSTVSAVAPAKQDSVIKVYAIILDEKNYNGLLQWINEVADEKPSIKKSYLQFIEANTRMLIDSAVHPPAIKPKTKR
jgi:hypothetical protein